MNKTIAYIFFHRDHSPKRDHLLLSPPHHPLNSGHFDNGHFFSDVAILKKKSGFNLRVAFVPHCCMSSAQTIRLLSGHSICLCRIFDPAAFFSSVIAATGHFNYRKGWGEASFFLLSFIMNEISTIGVRFFFADC